jgi:ABC-type amino acid transport substrate-binding protein
MSERLRVEDRITRWLTEEAPGEPPDRVVEGAFDRTRAMRQDPMPLLGRTFVSRRAAMLLVAILVIAASLVGYLVGGARPLFVIAPDRPADRLDEVRAAGTVRIAVRPDRPQAVAADGTVDGFDVDVAREIGRSLGVAVQIVRLPSADLLAGRDRWDVALASVDEGSVDAGAFVLTDPYYTWRRVLVVPAGSRAASVDDVRGQPICAVSGDAGQAWLVGASDGSRPTGTAAPPIPSSLILGASDDECLAALASGEVAATVTATLTPEEVVSRGVFRTIDGPPAEPFAALVTRAGSDPTTLVAGVDRAFTEMRRDGTLARLSIARFGSDLTLHAP